MTRIFFSLAAVCAVLLATNYYLGWTAGDYNALSQQYREQRAVAARSPEPAGVGVAEPWEAAAWEQTLEPLKVVQRRTRGHILLGVLAALFTILINSMAVTYFVGTGRWCKEVCETYALSPDFIQRSARLKRRSFVWSLAGMLTAVGITALGAAADPGTLRDTTAFWVAPHFLAASLGIPLILWTLWRQWQAIRANQLVITDILGEVRQVRVAKGLEVA